MFYSRASLLIICLLCIEQVHGQDSVNYDLRSDQISTAQIWDFASNAGSEPVTNNPEGLKANPTPAATNHLLFSSDPGFHNAPFYLIIESLSGDTVYYTLDGSTPSTSSSLYSDSIHIDHKTNAPNFFSEIPTSPEESLISYKAWESPDGLIHKANILRCASFKNGVRTSKIYTQTYFVDPEMQSRYTIPVISLVSDQENLFSHDSGIYVPGKHYDPADPEWTGNYFQKGNEWERPVHIEYFESDGGPGFSQDAGIRIHGLKTRQAAQKTLRLYAREEYGEKYFNYPLLPQKPVAEYKRFLLQTTMGSWRANTIIKDVLAHEIVRDLHIDHQDYIPVVVYLNGEYWGLHTIRDRIDERYIAYSHGWDKDFVDLINGNYGLVEAGSNEHYIELAEFIAQNDLSLEGNYDYVKTQIDITSFIDYQIAEMFFANRDWPRNNQMLWRPQTADGKWRWIFFDIDAGFGNHDANMIEQALLGDEDLTWQELPVSTYLFRNLLKNERFVALFVERYAEVLNNDFSSSLMLNKLNMVKGMYEDEVPRHISRWNYPGSVSVWERDIITELATFLEKRPCAVEDNITRHFDLTNFGFSCNQTHYISDSILIAPNPNNGVFSVHNNSTQNFLGNISIRDVSGRIIYFEDYIFLEKEEKTQLNISNVPNGIYFMLLEGNAHQTSKKFVISK